MDEHNQHFGDRGREPGGAIAEIWHRGNRQRSGTDTDGPACERSGAEVGS